MELLISIGVIVVVFVIAAVITNNWLGGIIGAFLVGAAIVVWFFFIAPLLNAPCPPGQGRPWGFCTPTGPVISEFSANPNEVQPGQQTWLYWVTQRADTVLLDGQKVDPTGSKNVTLDKSTTFKLVASGTGGPQVERTVSVRVPGTQPPGGQPPAPPTPGQPPAPPPGGQPAPGPGGLSAAELKTLVSATARPDGHPGPIISALDALWPRSSANKRESTTPGGSVPAGHLVWTNWNSGTPPNGVKPVVAEGGYGVFAVCRPQNKLPNGFRSIQADLSEYCK